VVGSNCIILIFVSHTCPGRILVAYQSPMKTNYLIKYLIILSAFLVVALVPDAYLFSGDHSLCLHRYLFHVDCPLCGMTRATHELSRFRIWRALGYNFNVMFLPLYITFDVALAVNGKMLYMKLRKITVVLLFTGLIVLYILRLGFHFGWFN